MASLPDISWLLSVLLRLGYRLAVGRLRSQMILAVTPLSGRLWLCILARSVPYNIQQHRDYKQR